MIKNGLLGQFTKEEIVSGLEHCLDERKLRQLERYLLNRRMDLALEKMEAEAERYGKALEARVAVLRVYAGKKVEDIPEDVINQLVEYETTMDKAQKMEQRYERAYQRLEKQLYG